MKLKRESVIALLACVGIALFGVLHFSAYSREHWGPLLGPDWPLAFVLVLGGGPLIWDLAKQAIRREFGSDLLAGISIVTSLALHEYLAGSIVVLMLSGGQTLESYALRSASSVLEALAARMPSVAHVKKGTDLVDVDLVAVPIDGVVVVFPHEVCPVDGSVTEGHGSMDESYLTGEPYMIMKAPGSEVLSGAINGNSAITVRVTKLAVDSRYSKIMEVMRSSAQHKPELRRIADQLGAYYTPLAVCIAIISWAISSDPTRFLAVLVIATPCPLLIAIPVAIIGSISLAAKRGIVIKDPSVLEQIDTCKVAIFDKTGTLTYGRPNLTELIPMSPWKEAEILSLVASLERYSKHPLAKSILERAESQGITLKDATAISENPGEGLVGNVAGNNVVVTSRTKYLLRPAEHDEVLPPVASGMECVVLVNDKLAAILRFRDEPRKGGLDFVKHLGSKHGFQRVILLSGDKESEVRYLADKIGIQEVRFNQSPEEKLEFVRKETLSEKTVFVGDGVNDAPALTASTVGIAFGQGSDITAAAAGAVILDSSLEKVDELIHIGKRMRRIALESAYGGMALSLVGMIIASTGHLPPVVGAMSQEVIDVLAVLNALRVAIRPKYLTDY